MDKKGHPVTDLKPEDFEIYDNGRKQTVRFFSRAGGESAQKPDNAAGQLEAVSSEDIFSNRRPDLSPETAHEKPASAAAEASSMILLIDSTNLAWTDLTYARAELLKFIRALPPDEIVGLYAMKASGFQVLEEGTTDHAELASKLTQWMPSAQDLARAQGMEVRNRQQFDTVLNTTDLQSVNGNINVMPDTASGVDPNLRGDGSNPGRDALLNLAGVARHLAAIPGHKNLVWVASDNMLADWSDKAVGSDKGSKHIDGFMLRVQEAMNDAHASVYPLDASQLETSAEGAELQNRNVGLSASVTAPPAPQRRCGAWPHNGRDAAEYASHSGRRAKNGGSYRRSCFSALRRHRRESEQGGR